MSSMMNKIADALTGGHHDNTHGAAGANTNTAAGNQAGGVGTNFAGSNYTQANNGALKEGAQVRDTGLTSAAHHTNTMGTNNNSNSSHLGRDAALATGAAGLASHHGTNSSLSSNTMSSSTTSTLGSSTAGSTMGTNTNTTGYATGATMGTNTATNTTGRQYEGSSDTAMTRSEEHLLVGKEKVNVGTASLNKYVTTEKVSTAVPIIREHAVVEREAITDANRGDAIRGADFKEAHYEVNLMEERAVAEKEVVPIERVRLRKEVEQTQQYVEAELRKEHIELVDPTKNINSGMGAGSATTSTTQSTTHSNTNSNIDNAARRM